MRVLRGEITVPGDKSVGHRACILSALSAGTSTVRGLGRGGDLGSTRRVVAALGADVHEDGTSFRIEGLGLHGLRTPDAPLDCGNSGTTMRLLSGLALATSWSVALGLRKLVLESMVALLHPAGNSKDAPWLAT